MSTRGDEGLKRDGHQMLRVNEKTTPPEPLSLRRNMFFNTVGSLMYQGCLWLTTVLVVVLSSGYNDSGLLAFAMTIGNMFNPIATYSMRPYQVSDVRGDYSQENYVAFRLVTLLLGFAVIIPYTFVVTSDLATIGVVLIYLVFKADEAFCDVLYGVDQRAERMDYIGISQFARGALLVGTFAGGLVVSGSLRVAIVAMSLSCIAITFAYDLPHASRIAPLRPRIDRAQVWALLKGCLPLVVSTLFIGMVVSVSRQWFSNAYGTEELGRYAAVATPAVLVQVAARYLYAPALVPLSECWDKDAGDFKANLLRTAGVMAIGSVVVAAVLSACGDPLLLRVYGQSIASYTYLFPLVLVGTVALAFLWFFADILVICRDLKGMLLAAVAAVVMTLVSMVPLESSFGMNGINLTVIAAALTGMLVALLRLRIRLRSTRRGAIDGGDR